MICHRCNCPMQTEPGSETGIVSPEVYITQEIKICPRCGLRIKERYEAVHELREIKL